MTLKDPDGIALEFYLLRPALIDARAGCSRREDLGSFRAGAFS